MKHSFLKIKDCAILIGYDPEGNCIYAEALDLADYYNVTHVWDDAGEVKKLRLERVKGFLFDADGLLAQEFESIFDLSTGIYHHGSARFADGTVQKDDD
jgi:hypothetical protein